MMEPKAGSDLSTAVTRSSGLTTVLGVVLIVLGIMALGAPMMTGIATGYVVGTLVTVGGIFRTFYAFKAGSLGRGLLSLLLGLFTVVLGLTMIAEPIFNLSFITLMLIIYFLVSGICEVVYSIDIRPAKGWVWPLVGGVISILLGWMLWQGWPLSGGWAVGILLGIRLITLGFAMIAVAAVARGIISDVQPVGS